MIVDEMMSSHGTIVIATDDKNLKNLHTCIHTNSYSMLVYDTILYTVHTPIHLAMYS